MRRAFSLVFCLALLPLFVQGAENSFDPELCDYNVEDTAIYGCKAAGCKTKLCVGVVTCKTKKDVPFSIDVACQVTSSGQCPSKPSDCIKDKTVEIQEPSGGVLENRGNNLNGSKSIGI